MSTSVSRSPREFLADTLGQVPRSGIRDFFDIVSEMDDVISLGVGEPGFDTPWHIREGAVFALEKGATGYTSNLGLSKARHAIAGYVNETFGIEYDGSTEVLITVGVSEGLDLAVRAITNPGDEILYHQPAYVSYGPVIQFAGGTPVSVQTTQGNGFRLTRDLLEPHVTPKTKALMLNYPNNPTGAVLPERELQGLADFAREYDLVVITDEIYAELTYDGTHTSIGSLPEMRDRTIFLHGFSKAWAMTGFRIGYACAPHDFIEAMMKIHQYTMLCAPILSQEAALEALKHPKEDIEEMRSEYRKRRNLVYASLNEMGLAQHKPGGAFYAFPHVGHLGMSSYDFAMRLLEEEKVAVVPGSAFGECGEGYIRCSYATGMDDLKEAMVRMARFAGRVTPE
jgi:aminotransferase